jgi:hypothetical protein
LGEPSLRPCAVPERDTAQTPTSADSIEELYRGPLDRFTAERNALAKRLREEGEKSTADEVAKLRKPSVAASLVNRLVHDHRKEFKKFLSAADELQRAQEEALRGEGADHLREATRGARDAIAALVEVARSEGGGAEATLDRVRETLEAAVADSAVRESVEGGRLEKELRPGVIATGPTGGATPKRQKDGGADDAEAEAEKEIEAAQRELDDLSERLAESERTELGLRQGREEAEQRLEQARQDLASARDESRTLRREVHSSQRRLDRLRKR